MARPDKVAAVASLAQSAKEAAAVILTEYRGLTVKQMKELRVSLEDVNYVVAKNKLSKLWKAWTRFSSDPPLLLSFPPTATPSRPPRL